MLIFIAALAAPLSAQEVIARDSAGLVALIKEHYGGWIADTCTVVMRDGDEYVTVHRNGPSGRYPVARFAVPRIEKLSGKDGDK